jgi:hypothetical protein
LRANEKSPNSGVGFIRISNRYAICERQLAAKQEARAMLGPSRRWVEQPTQERTFMRRLQRASCIKTSPIGSLFLSLGALVLLPSLSATEAQASKQTSSGQTNHAIVDNGVDSLQQFSTSMELLSKRVSPSVVQIFSTGYNLDTDREHNNTNLFSRRSSDVYSDVFNEGCFGKLGGVDW